MVVCFPHINLNVLRNFMSLYWATGLNRMGLKKDMRNDNLFLKRVTDIIIPDYPLYLWTCKNVQRSKKQVLALLDMHNLQVCRSNRNGSCKSTHGRCVARFSELGWLTHCRVSRCISIFSFKNVYWTKKEDGSDDIKYFSFLNC